MRRVYDVLRSWPGRHKINTEVATLSRPSIVEEIKRAEPELVKALAERFQSLLDDIRFVDAVSGHMPTDGASQARVPMILNVVKTIAEI